ncbi:MAG TPA: signal peptidase I [Candidatus Limnocylindrales bacterium]|nr:signal peptidase I [Candidatus Limnocylindrales bacterium]
MTQRPALGCLFEVVETLVLTLVIFLGIQTFVAQPYKVQQTSMEVTLLPDQYVLVDKLTPHWSAYARGDIVVFNPPPNWSESTGVPFIKRVIGLPGDTVELRDGDVYVNGVKLAEPYIHNDDGSTTTEPLDGNTSQWLVPDGDLFVMGDHRNASADSRIFGPIPISSVIGRAWLRYWPFDTLGTISRPTYPGLDGSAGAGRSNPSDVPSPAPSPSP